MGKRKPVALLSLSPWYLLIVVWLFLAVPWFCLQIVIVVFPDHTHFFWKKIFSLKYVARTGLKLRTPLTIHNMKIDYLSNMLLILLSRLMNLGQ